MVSAKNKNFDFGLDLVTGEYTAINMIRFAELDPHIIVASRAITVPIEEW